MKNYKISNNWKEAIKYGWEVGLISTKENLSEFESSTEMKKFVEDKLPKMFNDFYQKVIDEGKKFNIDDDELIGNCEEYLAGDLNNSLIWFGLRINKSLVKKI